MRVVSQSIPSELYTLYTGAFATTYDWKNKAIARKRNPFRIPTLQGGYTIGGSSPSGSGVSPAQIMQRSVFVSAVNCFNKQPATGGAEPPDTGPRNRSWWYSQSLGSGLFYYNYFMQQTINSILGGSAPDWCKIPITTFCWILSNVPNNNYSASSWFNMRDYYSYKYKVLMHNQEKKTATFYAKTRILNATYGTPKKLHIIGKIVAGGWDYTTVTWNTQPAIISTYLDKTYNLALYDWVAIPIPENEYLSLEIDWGGFGDAGSVYEVGFYGWNWGVKAYRCFFS